MAVMRSFYRGYASCNSLQEVLPIFGSSKDDPQWRCPLCRFSLRLFRARYGYILCEFTESGFDVEYLTDSGGMVPRSSVMHRFMDDLFFCPVCGWWHIERWRDGRSDLYLHAVLRTIDLSSPDVDIADLRSYLLRQWPDRKYISPHAAEELVRTVIRDFTGLEVEYFRGNTFAPDGGVDLIVCHDNEEPSHAIQVKRRSTERPESVAEVRAFLGALVDSDFDQGLLVTLAERFSDQAIKTASSANLQRRGLTLELVDGRRLLDLLRVTTPPPNLRLPVFNGTVWREHAASFGDGGEGPSWAATGRWAQDIKDILGRDFEQEPQVPWF